MAAIAKEPAQSEKSLEEQLQFQKRLNTITNKIHSAKDTDDILFNLQDEILALFDADRITVYVVDGASRQVVSRFKTGSEASEIRVPINNDSITGYCASFGKVINITDAYDEKELKRINADLNFDRSWDKKSGFKTKQVLVAPITFNRYLLGVIQLINKKKGNNFTLEDQSSVLEIARVLGVAFFNNQKLAKKSKPTKFDHLISNHIISHKDLERAMVTARKTKKQVESVLMSDFNVSKDDVGKSLSDYYKTQFVPYDERMVIPGQLLKGLKMNFLKKNIFVPLSQSGNKIVVAMENPDPVDSSQAVRILRRPERGYLQDDRSLLWR
jgi:transcriptional regulator with GAF, ATPase, and Fis domain